MCVFIYTQMYTFGIPVDEEAVEVTFAEVEELDADEGPVDADDVVFSDDDDDVDDVVVEVVAEPQSIAYQKPLCD